MTLKLNGLRADTAHGFLAAVGLIQALRSSSECVKLSWTNDFFPRAVLDGLDSLTDLVALVLADRDRRMKGVVLNYPSNAPFPTLGRTPEELSEWASAVANADAAGDPDCDLWAGLVIEGGYTAGGKSKPTHLDFTAGQKQFLKIARSLGQALDVDQVVEAVDGPWRWTGKSSTFGFEATGERLSALRAIPPGQDQVYGVPGADWLAFLGLAYYQLALVSGRDRARVLTPACDADWNRSNFRWPVWNAPLDHRAIAAVVTHPGLVGENPDSRTVDPEQLAALDISAIYQCPITRSTQGYGSFGPPHVLARGSN